MVSCVLFSLMIICVLLPLVGSGCGRVEVIGEIVIVVFVRQEESKPLSESLAAFRCSVRKQMNGRHAAEISYPPPIVFGSFIENSNMTQYPFGGALWLILAKNREERDKRRNLRQPHRLFKPAPTTVRFAPTPLKSIPLLGTATRLAFAPSHARPVNNPNARFSFAAMPR